MVACVRATPRMTSNSRNQCRTLREWPSSHWSVRPTDQELVPSKLYLKQPGADLKQRNLDSPLASLFWKTTASVPNSYQTERHVVKVSKQRSQVPALLFYPDIHNTVRNRTSNCDRCHVVKLSYSTQQYCAPVCLFTMWTTVGTPMLNNRAGRHVFKLSYCIEQYQAPTVHPKLLAILPGPNSKLTAQTVMSSNRLTAFNEITSPPPWNTW